MSVNLESISGVGCLKTVAQLTGFGIRFAGSDQEQKAANWIEERFKQAGLRPTSQHKFPCLSFSCEHCQVSFPESSAWREIPSEPGAHSPSSGGEALEAPLVNLEKIPGSLEACRKRVEGKIGLLYASELFQPGKFKRLMQAEPAGLLLVDDRFPNEWTIAIGFPGQWLELIPCPVVNISYFDAWELVRKRIQRVRIDIQSEVFKARSQNVIGEIEGSDLKEEVIVISAHHDSVLNNPGADDNLTGVAAVIALAQAFSPEKPRRTLRFITYGAEEQLSEGARQYAETVEDLQRIQFVLNIDSIGALMGQTGIYFAGSDRLKNLLQEVNAERDFPGHLSGELSPFSDHFPLNVRGVPAAWYYRKTFVAARHFHHSSLETLDVLSPEILEDTVRHQAVLLDRVANQDPLPFENRISEDQLETLRQMGREWCGME